MAVVKKFMAGVAAVVAIGVLAAPSVAAEIELAPVKKILGVPAIACSPTQLSYVIDGGNVAATCGGKSTMIGNGWQNYVWPGAINTNYYYVSAIKGEDMTEKITFFPTITVPGFYEVWASYRGSENRSEATPFFVFTDSRTDPGKPGATYKVVVNQKELGHGAFFSAKLGTFFFGKHALNEPQRKTGIVTCQNEGPRSSESVDAVFFKYVGPVAPAVVTASDATSATGITVRWQAVEDPGAKYYQIFRNTVNNPNTAQMIKKVGSKTTQYVDQAVGEGETYFYWVKTQGWLGKFSTFSPGNEGSTGFAPAQVTAVVAEPDTTAGEVNVSWAAAGHTDSYEVFRTLSATPPGPTDVPTATVAHPTVTHQDTGLASGTYHYFVRGVNAIATGAFSDAAMVVVP